MCHGTTQHTHEAILATETINRMAHGATRILPGKRANTPTDQPYFPTKRRKPTLRGNTSETEPQIRQLKQKAPLSLTSSKTTRKDLWAVPEGGEEELTQPSLQRSRNTKLQQAPIAEGTIEELPSRPDMSSSPAKATRSKTGTAGPSPPEPATNGEPRPNRGRPKKPVIFLPKRRSSDHSVENNGSGKTDKKLETGNDGAQNSGRRLSEAEENIKDVTSAAHRDRNKLAQQATDAENVVEELLAEQEQPVEQEDSNDEDFREAQEHQDKQTDEDGSQSSWQQSDESSCEEEELTGLPKFWGIIPFPHFEQQARLHGCGEYWKKMWKAARKNRATVIKPETSTIAKFEKLIKSAIESINEAEEEDSADMEEIKDRVITARLCWIEKASTSIRRTESAADNSKLIRDLYTVAIPSMVFLIKNIVKFRFENGMLNSEALREVTDLMNSAHHLCMTAFHWKPRPASLDGVLGNTRNRITVNLANIRKAYLDAKQTLDRPLIRREKLMILEKNRRGIAERNRLKREEEQREREEYRKSRAVDLVRQKNGSPNRQRSNPPRLDSIQPAGEQVSDDIINIDDLDFESDHRINVYRPHSNHRSSAVVRGKLPKRPSRMGQRERTPDIPAPVPATPEWSEDEKVALLNGLEEFTGSDRFERILDAYGSADGPGWLAKRDLDEMMQQAKFFKQTMAGQLEDKRFDWLRSVPG